MSEMTREDRWNELVAQGDTEALARLVALYRPGLKRLVCSRLDRRLQGRLDPSDVVQEACLEAARRLNEYVRSPTLPFQTWLRCVTWQKLLQLHRRHLSTKARDAKRDVSLYRFSASSAELADRLASQLTSPSQKVIKEESKARLRAAIEELAEIDAEILVLHHFEQLSLKEAAEALNITHSAACNRYFRALKRIAARMGETLG